MSTLFIHYDYDDTQHRNLKWIRSDVDFYVYNSPIRLFDIVMGRMISREELSDHLFEAVTKHVSSPPLLQDDFSPECEDPKAAVDRQLGMIGQELYFVNDIFTLAQFYGKYAILSHRWSKNEILFSDTPTLDETKTRKPEGYRKFLGFVSVVKDRDPLCRYIWMDTMCINKDSSTELDESIRSMHTWYRNSTVCIVHLAETMSEPSAEALAADSWFQRGWTLQELLSPTRIKFYASDWAELYPNTLQDIEYGVFVRSPVREDIINASGVDSQYFWSMLVPNAGLAPVIFSWAGQRQTTRPEDIAYCLVGLLDVHFPIAYGEGLERAFYRLQVACMQSSPSRGLFLWDPPPNYQLWNFNSMLAPHPHVFTAPDSDIVCNTVAGFENIDFTFSITNGVLQITMWILPVRSVETTRWGLQGHLFKSNDFEIELWWWCQDKCDVADSDMQNLVVGVYGFVGETMHAVILEKMSAGSWIRAFRFCIKRLPSKSDLEESKVAPQLVFIE